MTDKPVAHTTEAETPPPFDPDPELVADVESNRFALRAFRKAASDAHEQAEAERRPA